MRKLADLLFLISLVALAASPIMVQAAEIERIAVGVHPTFTRVVLHMNEATAFTQEHDKDGNPSLLLINVAKPGPTQAFSENHNPVSGLSYDQNEDGLRVSFTTANATKVKSFALTSDDYGGHRVVVDFFKSEDTPSLTDRIREPVTKPEPQPTLTPVATASKPQLKPEPRLKSPEERTPPQDDPCRQTQIMLNQNQWNMAALIDHGLCKKEAGRLEEAQSILERILTFDPEFHRARIALAEVYATRGFSSKAREEYSYVLKTNPPTDVRSTIEQRLAQLQ